MKKLTFYCSFFILYIGVIFLTKYYLAVDIGASSGRHIIGYMENGKIELKEVHRFENKQVKRDGHLCWEADRLFNEIVEGMRKCKEAGMIPCSMAIDCFGVDFVLLDENEKVLGDTVAYRDSRTEKHIATVLEKIPDLYEKTGISKQPFNTIFQLYALDKECPDFKNKAKRFLMLAEYFNFLLTGNKVNEYTNATTTSLLDAYKEDFAKEIVEETGFSADIFEKPQKPGTSVGTLRKEIVDKIGYDCEVILAPSHDTASAVAAVPCAQQCIYISSGTWSLMGVLLESPRCEKKYEELGFTNEGGLGNIRFLKNIMGLWIIQSIKRELNNEYSFPQMSDLARESSYNYAIDPNDGIFFAPESMIDAVKANLKENGFPKPESIGDVLKAVYLGLSGLYAKTAEQLDEIAGKKFGEIYIIGGGSRDTYLNELTAKASGKKVIAGPTEATATGNILIQMEKGKECSRNEFADLIKKSFDVSEFEV